MTKLHTHTIYRLADGTRVPSVTTILSILNKPAVTHWAWQQGMEGLDYRQVRDQAADIGSLVHYLIMSELKKTEPDVSGYSEQDQAAAARSMMAYHAWVKGRARYFVDLVESPLVSETYHFGGTPDFYGWIDDDLTLVDFKSGGGIYNEHLHQVAAYAALLEEHQKPVEKIIILRIGHGADDGYEEKVLINRDDHFKIFLAAQTIYNLTKEVKRK